MQSVAGPLETERPQPRRRVLDPRSYRRMAFAIVGLVVLMVVSELGGFMTVGADQARQNQMRFGNRELRVIQQALVDAETGVRGFLLTGQPDFLDPYQSGLRMMAVFPPAMTAQLDQLTPPQSGASQPGSLPGRTTNFSQTLSALRTLWSSEIKDASARTTDAARTDAQLAQGKALMDTLRADVAGVMAQRDANVVDSEGHIATERDASLLLILLGGITAVGALVYAFDRSIRDAVRRDRAVKRSEEVSRQIQILLAMAEMLQSANDRDDANEVLRATASQLLPGMGGALYVFNNSRDRLDLSTSWLPIKGAAHDAPPDRERPDHIAPSSCWAIKRGKTHRNFGGDGALRCSHSPAGAKSLEIPMSARGELYGLLEIIAHGPEAEEQLRKAKTLASALADAMSLALSSAALREQLRNQALRDPLTGLYNRRFMEEMLDRTKQDAERRRLSLSAVMIDLDHFKTLNDQFGHATGDAVLRQVAGAITGVLRGSDVACRYGGEELAILMPDCSMEMAMARAEQIRAAIANASSDGRIPPVTASLGVSSRPETTSRAEDLLPQADAALYLAKQGGRNAVVGAAIRPHAPTLVLAEGR